MKLNAAIKVGVIGGLVAGLCLQLTSYIGFYETTFQFSAPGWLATLLNILFWPLMVITVLALGPLTIRYAGEEVSDWRQAGLVGGGAGLVAGSAFFLVSGVVATVVVLGVVPLIGPLSVPDGTPVDQVLRPVVQDVVGQVYLIESAFILGWAVLGAVTGAVSVFARPLFRRKEKAVQPA